MERRPAPHPHDPRRSGTLSRTRRRRGGACQASLLALTVAVDRRGRRGRGAGGERRVDRHHRVVRAGQPQQRQGPGRLQPVHRRRRPDHPVDPQRRHPAAVAVRRLRQRLLPAQVPAVGQGPRRLQPLHRRRRRRSSSGPTPTAPTSSCALPTRRRLRPAHQPQQRQGPRGPGRLHRRRRQHRPVRRLERHQPAVAARPPSAAPRPPATADAAADRRGAPCRRRYRWTSTGLAGQPEVGLGLAEGLHHRPVQRQAPGLRDDARQRDRRGAR